jgi:hypothetical protein
MAARVLAVVGGVPLRGVGSLPSCLAITAPFSSQRHAAQHGLIYIADRKIQHKPETDEMQHVAQG